MSNQETVTPEHALHVIVVGAGATGLLIGQALKQAEIRCTILERTEHTTYATRARDWSMGLHWGNEHLRSLPPELIEQLKKAETDPWTELTAEQETTQPVCNGRTGEVFAHIDAISTRRVSRSRLRKALSHGLGIRYGHEIVSIEVDSDKSSVTATCANGYRVTGSMLVGCDAANSFVRSWLLGEELARCEELPMIAYNFSCQYTAEQARWLRAHHSHPLMSVAPHPDQHTWYIQPILNVQDPNDPSSWVFQHFLSFWTDEPTPETSEERLAHFKMLAMNYGEPFQSAATGVRDDTYVPHDRIKHWPDICRWNNYDGRVTLAGDAAHPMAPYRAQGLNNALMDAAKYADATIAYQKAGTSRSTCLAAAIDAFDEEVFQRGKREIKVSAEQGYAATHWEKYLDSPVLKHGHANTAKVES